MGLLKRLLHQFRSDKELGKFIRLSKKLRLLPKLILFEKEIIKLIKAANTKTNQGYRDRAIVKILYDTAIRGSKLSTLRHPCAAHMLRNGASVLYVQEMLGYRALNTTQIYTQVTINYFERVYTNCPPSSNIKF